MVRKSALAAVALWMALVLAAPAHGHESMRRFSDPTGDGQADITATAKAMVHKAPHHHRTKFTLRLLAPDWHVTLRVDSRGGPRADFKLLASEDLGTSQCSGTRRGGEEIELRCGHRVAAFVGDWKAWWSIRRSVLDPTKRIRWRVVSDYPGEPVPGVPEKDWAPDAGWYA
jgi:hypothetical protein